MIRNSSCVSTRDRKAGGVFCKSSASLTNTITDMGSYLSTSPLHSQGICCYTKTLQNDLMNRRKFKVFYTSDQLRSVELVSFIFSCNFHVSSAGLAFSNFSYINLLLLIKTHFYTKGEMSNFYLKESMFYIPVQDVDMFSTIHPKPKTFRERLKNKFCLVQTSNQFKSKEQSKSS